MAPLCFPRCTRVFIVRTSRLDRDVATIALANASMGDYKLKSSEDYEVGHAKGTD